MRGKQEKTQELTPEAKEQYQIAKQLAAIGTPMYYGPEIAAINEAELGSRANVNTMASSLGLQGAGELSIGAPTATQGGVTGYTTYQGAQSALDMLKKYEPGRYQALMNMMIDPVTGEMPDFVAGQTSAAPAVSAVSGGDDGPSMREFMEQARENARRRSGVPQTGDYPNMTSMPAIAGYTTPATPAESSFGSDLSRSLTDSSYDPPGTVFSRTVDKLKTGLLG